MPIGSFSFGGGGHNPHSQPPWWREVIYWFLQDKRRLIALCALCGLLVAGLLLWLRPGEKSVQTVTEVAPSAGSSAVDDPQARIDRLARTVAEVRSRVKDLEEKRVRSETVEQTRAPHQEAGHSSGEDRGKVLRQECRHLGSRTEPDEEDHKNILAEMAKTKLTAQAVCEVALRQ